MYKIYILQKKLVQIDQSSPQQWSEYFTAAHMGFPPPTRSIQRANGQYRDHLVGQLTTTIKDRGYTSKGAFIYKTHVKSTNGKVYIWICGLKFLVLVAPMVREAAKVK